MDRTEFEINKLHEMLEAANSSLSRPEQAAYYAAAHTIIGHMESRWDEEELAGRGNLMGIVTDFMWNLSVLLEFDSPNMPMAEHYSRGLAKITTLRHQYKRVQ